MTTPRPTCVDFETGPIGPRPDYPPEPVGVAIKRPGRAARYLAWGHPAGNNTTREAARAELADLWREARCVDSAGLLFWNAKFDLAVAEERLGLAPPAWERVHDAMLLRFLDEPRAITLALKPTAHELLRLPPGEQDAVRDWLLANQPRYHAADGAEEAPLIDQYVAPYRGAAPPGTRVTRKNFGAYIALAPAGLVGAYAIGDAERTVRLFDQLHRRVDRGGMLGAYDRERRLLPILMGMERRGMRVDAERLDRDVRDGAVVLDRVDGWVRQTLDAPGLSLDAPADLADALVRAGAADAATLGETRTGRVAANKRALAEGVADPALAALLRYRASLRMALATFCRPWLAQAMRTGGLVHTEWNQVRSAEGFHALGARTGRLSSSGPNLQNVPGAWPALFAHEKPGNGLPECSVPGGLPPLPHVRGYVVPYQTGDVLVGRDVCFPPDTEVLTADGFVRFDQLPRDARVAEWCDGQIRYSVPVAYQVLDFSGDLLNIVGTHTVDLLVTPEHLCMLLNDRGEAVFRRAKDYPTAHHKQVQAGTLRGGKEIANWVVRLVAAVQADASVRYGRLRETCVLTWKLKKTRKKERLREILQEGAVPYREATYSCSPGFSWFKVRMAELKVRAPEFFDLLLLSEHHRDTTAAKTFSRRLLDSSLGARRVFVRELGWWDGRRTGRPKTPPTAWSYFSTHVGNVLLVQELSVVSGFRCTLYAGATRSGKPFYSVGIRENPATYTDRFTVRPVPYVGKVYCLSMPWSTVIVQRNGKVMVTGQCQQELRILAHYEDGVLRDGYRADPWLDVHEHARVLLSRMLGREMERKPVKNMGFGLIYGMGLAKLAAQNGTSVEEARELKRAYLAIFPGLRAMDRDLKARAAADAPIRTWSGRVYRVEPPQIVDGEMREYAYRLLNTLIQGSAADATKELMCRYAAAAPTSHLLILSVHDELLASAPAGELAEAQRIMREAMDGLEFDVPMRSEGTWGADWGSMIPWDKRGVEVAA